MIPAGRVGSCILFQSDDGSELTSGSIVPEISGYAFAERLRAVFRRGGQRGCFLLQLHGSIHF